MSANEPTADIKLSVPDMKYTQDVNGVHGVKRPKARDSESIGEEVVPRDVES